jgi:sulfite exporter TauE/SafE
MEGFLLGLANGTVCLSSCAPVLVPYLLGQGQTVRRNYLDLGRFLAGRLIGYLLIAVLAWALGLLVEQKNVYREVLFGGSYCFLAALLIYYSFRKKSVLCAMEYVKSDLPGFIKQSSLLLPFALGLLTGLNLCPPLLMALTGAASEGNLVASLFFFSAFFLGTSVFFLPIPFMGLIKRKEALQTIGKMAAGLIGVYYFCMGVLILLGGVRQL